VLHLNGNGHAGGGPQHERQELVHERQVVAGQAVVAHQQPAAALLNREAAVREAV
jgi:hypothetical protein